MGKGIDLTTEKPHISACLVVYNEEKVIERCLSSIADFCDEIIVIHDGQCADKTLEIARRYTERIYIKEHIGVPEPHRPATFEYASGEWILQLDADEYLTEESKKLIRAEICSETPADGYSLTWPLWDGNKYLTSKWPFKFCFFRRDKMHYIGFPHNEATVDGKRKRLSARLEHQPQYNNLSLKSFQIKHKKWIKNHAGFLNQDIYFLNSFNVSGERKWPLHMGLIKKYKLFSIPINFFVFFLGYFREKKVYYTPLAVFRYFIVNYCYYVSLAIEYWKKTKT
jgi:glycosyltransferase involved in cell wall biosynthesis